MVDFQDITIISPDSSERLSDRELVDYRNLRESLIGIGESIVVDPVLEFVDAIVDPVFVSGATGRIGFSFKVEARV